MKQFEANQVINGTFGDAWVRSFLERRRLKLPTATFPGRVI